MPDYDYSCRSLPLSETACEKGNHHPQAVGTVAGLHASTARIRDTVHAEQLMQNNRYMEELKEQLSGQEMNSEELHEYREQIDSLQVENSRLSEKINYLQHHINDYSSKLDKGRNSLPEAEGTCAYRLCGGQRQTGEGTERKMPCPGDR